MEKVQVKNYPQNAKMGRFVAEPLERGFGNTLGNSLRRVLLSSLEGAAVTSVHITGITHEFTAIPNVKEDVLDLVLNIKQINVRSYSAEPKVMKLSVKGKAEVTAADIEHDAEIEIINPEQYLATVEKGGKLEIEFVVEKGKGYRPSELNKKSGQAVGTLPLDAIFPPVKKVNFSVEEIRVGEQIGFDRLVLDIWTNGAVTPQEALTASAKILIDQLSVFLKGEEKEEALAAAIGLVQPGSTDQPLSDEAKAEAARRMSIDDLDFSARTRNGLKAAEIGSIGDMLGYSRKELLKLDGLGEKSLDEIVEKLKKFNLALKEEE